MHTWPTFCLVVVQSQRLLVAIHDDIFNLVSVIISFISTPQGDSVPSQGHTVKGIVSTSICADRSKLCNFP